MRIHIKFFARARDLAGTSDFDLVTPNPCAVSDAKLLLLDHFPQLASVMPFLLIAVDGDYASDQTPLRDGCELACFPPVSGG